jgi:hypothetical protein
MTSSFIEQFTGLYATPELVGRRDILSKFERILDDPSPKPKLVFVYGLGGIGKTRLLKRALELAKTNPNHRVAEDVLDLYHIALHTPIGLANAIFEILTPPFDCFQAYQPAYQALNRARLSGNVVELEKLREDAVNTFEQDFQRLSAARRVILGLDTLERVVYGMPGKTDNIPLADSWNWLIELLPKLGNVTLFVAGREEANHALEQAKAQNTVLVEEIEVGPFELEESLEYFDNVARLAEEKKDRHIAERLRNLPEDFKKGAHAYSRGRPILLSLFVDYLSFPEESEVPVILQQTLPPHVEPEDSRRYEEILFDRLRQGELGDTLIALGRVPKGADEELLAALLGIPTSEAIKHLADVQSLSVVKIRPEDRRVFLHDEMYELLQRNVYDSPYDGDAQKAAFDAIKNYYQKQRERISHRLNELYAPIEEQGKESLDMKMLGEVHTQYQALLTEIMYYFLRHDFGRGFRAYYRYSHEAIMARDIQMDLQLQAELLSYLSRLLAQTPAKNVSIDFTFESLKVRPLARAWALGKYQEGLKETHNFIESVEKSWGSQFPSLLAAAHVWIASLHIMRGTKEDQFEAENHLAQAYALLPREEVLSPFADPIYPDTFLWHKKAIFALAHRVNAYLRRVQGLMKGAVIEYQQAAVILREIDLRKEMATVMNDMGFVQAELGQWHDGRSNVIDALRLGRELGPRVPVALSFNTLASIDVLEGQYASARENSERALSIFRALSYKRGIGMALVTLAEALRRYAGSTPLLRVEERMELLRRARDYSREANSLFAELGESSRQVEALIEIGCACRDWVFQLKASPRLGDNRERIVKESEDTLEQAADLARQNVVAYRHVDALVNLAWLQFYLLEDEEDVTENHPLSVSINKAEKAFPEEIEMEKQPQVWAQKGKLHILKGNLAYWQFIQERRKAPKLISDEVKHVLEQTAENYTLALDYSSRFAQDYQGIRQAKDGMFARLRRLNAAEMRLVCNRIRSLYPNGSVIQTFLNNRALWQSA